MTCIGGVDTTNTAFLLSMSLQDRISSSPAEPDRAHLIRAGDLAHGIDEARDQGLGDCFTVFDEPGAQGGGSDGRILGFVYQASLFAVFERGLDSLKEGDWERIALVDVGDIAVQASFSVVVGEQTDILKLPSKDLIK